MIELIINEHIGGCVLKKTFPTNYIIILNDAKSGYLGFKHSSLYMHVYRGKKDLVEKQNVQSY